MTQNCVTGLLRSKRLRNRLQRVVAMRGPDQGGRVLCPGALYRAWICRDCGNGGSWWWRKFWPWACDLGWWFRRRPIRCCLGRAVDVQ